MYRYLAGAVVAAVLLSGAPASAQDKLTVFWGKGFYKAEDDALFAAVKKFEEKTNDQDRHLAVLAAGHDPEDRGGDGFRDAAGRRLW